ncbi:MAG: transcription elongation factor GreA [Chloroflexi bacterium]|nr:transcription elongation factor GreA [Chloroflexota bacterium]
MNRFVRWFGAERPLSEVTAPRLGAYADQLARSGSDINGKLEPVRGFLIFAKKSGLVQSNLSVHLRVSGQASRRKATSKTSKGNAGDEMSLTAQGLEELKRELESLKKERPKAQLEIQRAAADKDVRENAPLEAAREFHGHLEGRIRELESIIKGSRVIEGDGKPAIAVTQGNKVTIRDLESGETLCYSLVDPREVNPGKGKISFVSPVGKALMGKSVGAVVGVTAPAGLIHYRIEKIEP